MVSYLVAGGGFTILLMRGEPQLDMSSVAGRGLTDTRACKPAKVSGRRAELRYRPPPSPHCSTCSPLSALRVDRVEAEADAQSDSDSEGGSPSTSTS